VIEPKGGFANAFDRDYTKDDPARDVGSGLSELDVGLRLRYEITRRFAPYVGVSYLGQFGRTAQFVRAAGGQTDQIRFVRLTRLVLTGR